MIKKIQSIKKFQLSYDNFKILKNYNKKNKIYSTPLDLTKNFLIKLRYN